MNQIKRELFGTTKNGETVDRYILSNANHMEVSIITYGGAVQSVITLDKTGQKRDVVLGYDDVASYEAQTFYIGALIGRHANRIAKGHFTLNQKDYQLYCNNGKNHLHGGQIGFDKKVWTAKIDGTDLILQYTSPDGEENFPGTLEVTVRYSLSDDNSLSIDYSAVCDQDTVCNLTNHSYFNLGGHDSGNVLSQKIQLFADHYTEADAESLPNGKILPVEGTPLDLRKLTKIGEHIDDDFAQLQFAAGFDHNWVINDFDGTLKKAAFACNEQTGITLTAATTLPGVQFYSGNYLETGIAGKKQADIVRRGAFCLESQYFPNALEHPAFLQPILKKGETWHAQTTYTLGLLT